MTQIALDGLDVIAVRNGNDSVLMAQIMEAERRTTHLFDHSFEAIIDCAVRQDIALPVREDKVSFNSCLFCRFHQCLFLLLQLEQVNHRRRNRKSSTFAILR